MGGGSIATVNSVEDATAYGWYSFSGGGATDIRLVSGVWDDATSLNSRIMVAAGGSGGIYRKETYGLYGAVGGTLSGADGQYYALNLNSLGTGELNLREAILYIHQPMLLTLEDLGMVVA